MSKKVISILLSAAMLVAIFCVGFGALSASADDNVTYYFLAPDNYFKTEAGASNTNVGYYFWEAGGNGAWPGQAATPAPEVHPNAFKISVPNNDNVATIIFNAFVDAGNEGDPNHDELAKVAHQTADINVEDEDYDGYIYVLAQDAAHTSTNDHSGVVKSSGNWFKLDEFKTSYNYGTYGFADATNTPDTPNPSNPSTKKYAAGDIVTVTYNVKDLAGLGAANSIISYNKDVLAVDDSAFEFRGNKRWYEAGKVAVTLAINDTDAGIEIGLNPSDPEYGAEAKDESTIVTIQFKALKDFDEDDANIQLTTDKLIDLTTGTPNDITADADKYLFLNVAWPTPRELPTSSTSSTASTSSTVTSSTATSSTAASSTTSSDPKGTNDKASSTTSGGKPTTSTSTTAASSTTPTVQTAGTFAVISLVVILMAAAGVVIYTRKKTEE